MSTKKKRVDTLERAISIISSDREQSNGKPSLTFKLTTALFQSYLDHRPDVPLSNYDICNLNILQKIARSAAAPADDHFLDIAGYAALANELFHDDQS